MKTPLFKTLCTGLNGIYIYIYDINDLLDANVLKRKLSDLETVQSMSSKELV